MSKLPPLVRHYRVGNAMPVLTVILILVAMELLSAKNLRPYSTGQHVSQNTRDWLEARRSLISTRDPQCMLPTEDPCTLNTTAIGMVEAGYATYYDE